MNSHGQSDIYILGGWCHTLRHIDEVKLFSRALSSSEISSVMFSRIDDLGPDASLVSSLEAYFRFNEAQGLSAFSSGSVASMVGSLTNKIASSSVYPQWEYVSAPWEPTTVGALDSSPYEMNQC